MQYGTMEPWNLGTINSLCQSFNYTLFGPRDLMKLYTDEVCKGPVTTLIIPI